MFVADNARSVPAAELVARLDDELFAVNERLGAGTFPKSAKAYLDDWSAPDRMPRGCASTTHPTRMRRTTT
ncbi:DUF3375 family protein [Actinocrinis sp.]|uniref:DUF3375 family protein n=1 Tax=Actinocrinis sp. TaxID=1920516 RepID=UPI0032C21086